MNAAARLQSRLLELAQFRTFPPCVGNADAFFDGGPDRLAAAAMLCRRCPVRAECAAAADEQGERWGVWGGRVREKGAA